MVHENVPHDASGNRQEMRPVLPRNILGIDQAQIGFIDERRRLKAVPGTLSCHAPSRDLVELPLYERNQLVEGGRVPLTPFQAQCGGLRGMVRNVAILSSFAWFIVLRPVLALHALSRAASTARVRLRAKRSGETSPKPWRRRADRVARSHCSLASSSERQVYETAS